MFVMDCDVAAASDNVSHHLIVDAMEAMESSPGVGLSVAQRIQGIRHLHQVGCRHDSGDSSHAFSSAR